MRDKLKEMAERIENDKSNYSMSNINLFNKSGSADRHREQLNASVTMNSSNGSLFTPKDNRIISIAQIAEVSPIISASRSGARHPGLTAKNFSANLSNSSTPRFLNTNRPSVNGTPSMLASSVSTACSTPANNSLKKNTAALTSSFVANRLLKRTSDHLVKHEMSSTTLSEDEDDSIISNQDLEALFSNQQSNLSSAKRKKI